REISRASDLQGLRMRIPGLGGRVMSELGVTVQVLGGADIYPALERGTIDATEWVGPYDDAKLGFPRVARFYYYPGWWEPGPSLSYMVNLKALEELPSSYREMFEAAAAESATVMQARYDALNPQALETLLGEGVEMRPFSDEILIAAREASLALLEDEAAKDATYRKIFEPWKKARKAAYRWFSTAELAYARMAFPAG
ncbi:MAG: hypothetical protein MI919_30855, partial [Holophagales bacterium]|nr:hypothetical protein [Holophagales bacterium]